ncbi:MAG: ATP-binding protein [Pseudomonadota bacterium]
MAQTESYPDNAALLQDLHSIGEVMVERALLVRQLQSEPVADTGSQANPSSKPGKLDSLLLQAVKQQAPQRQLQAELDTINAELDTLWQSYRQRSGATLQNNTFIPWIHVVQLFHPSELEQQLLLFGLLVEMEPRYAAILRALDTLTAGDEATDGVKLRGAWQVLGGGVPQRLQLQQSLAPDACLRNWDLLALSPETNLGTLDGSYRLPMIISAYLLGQAAPQLRLEQVLQACPANRPLPEHPVDPAVLQQLSFLVERFQTDASAADSYVLQLQGPDMPLLCSLAGAVFSLLGMVCVLLDGRQIAQVYAQVQKSRPALLRRLRLLLRDVLLCNRVIVLQNCQWLSSAENSEDLLDDVLNLAMESQMFLVIVNGPARRIHEAAHRFTEHKVASILLKIAMPDTRLRQQIWQSEAASLQLGQEVIDQLVNNYLFTEEQIRLVLREVVSSQMLAPDASSLESVLFDTCRDQSNRELMTVAQEVKTPHKMADIILPDSTRQWLGEVLQYARQRHQVIETWGFDAKNQNSKNLCVLFYGPSGTGKTMAASIIANELNLGLYKIDLANVISKYIGETEKQLAQLFDQAEAMNIVLFFDEAESLFGKRTESKDSHDRYANLQTGYLLQRIETYPGIVILSTNLLANIDQAFTRRFKFMIEYPFPSTDQRLLLWQNAFPKATPLAPDLDFPLLANRAPLSGGNINNIAINAAFLAAAEKQSVAQKHVLQATEREYHKLGKVFLAREFEWGEDE